ncbi:MAG: EamA family transporter [Alicyclobacillus herbarius]|nr:EamA family transporter [Alicyclobacillus herbarius]
MVQQAVFVVLMLVAGSCFGVISPLMKLSYAHGFTAQQVTDAQYGFAVVILWALGVWQAHRLRLPLRQWLLLAVLGASGAGTSLCYYLSLTRLPASLGIIMLFQFAWMVMVIDILVTHRLPATQKWLGLLMIVLGTILAVGILGERLPRFPMWAVGLGLLGGLFYALTLYLSGYVDEATPPVTRSAVTVTFSGLVILPFFPPSFLWDGSIPRGLWLWGGLVALFGQVLPMLCMLLSIPRIGGRMAGVLASVELPVAVLSAHLVLGEPVSWLRWLGVVLILLGICVSEWPGGGRRRTKSKTPALEP